MCEKWFDPNHTYFHIANLFLALTYFCPNNLKGLIVLRLFLGTAGVFFCLWAGIILCSPDTLGWNLVFAVINYGHVAYLWYIMRPIKFSEEHEILYAAVFEQLGIARYQYNGLVQLASVKELAKGEHYSKENETHGENISIVTSGSALVMKSGKVLHRTKPYEFIDSPEWILSTQGNFAAPVTFEVTVISEGCTLISWKRSDLLRTLRQQPQVKNIFNSIIGQDIALKLFKSNRVLDNANGSEMSNIMYGREDKLHENESVVMGVYNQTFNPKLKDDEPITA